MNSLPSTMLFAVDATEHRPRTAGRPLSRAEIFARHLRDQRGLIPPRQTVRAARIAHAPARPTPLTPAAKVRRGIAHALIAVGHRIDREAA